MKLSLQDYRSKLEGCWLGKNIGGTLGAPFECKRGVFDVSFYTQELYGEPLPNDDLDLQLIWLNAAEKYGTAVNARILAEYWISYISPNMGEYGAGKNNLRAGLVPPLSGYYHNLYRDSNGAFIRSEIWACLAPGHPEIAAKYAYEDAIVDHSHEGVYAEVFCAAIESAAFVESDTYRLIAIGLSYIPEESGVAKAVKTAIESYQSGVTWQEARINVLTAVPGSFGLLSTSAIDPQQDDVPVGPIGYDAPSNVGIMIIGWLYGEGDFEKSICIATNCGEDTDCTAATIGSILGIILGKEGLPSKWLDPIGDTIKTITLNVCDQGTRIPTTVGELTERVLRLAPTFLGTEYCDLLHAGEGYQVEMNEGDQLFDHPVRINAWKNKSFKDTLSLSPFGVKYDFSIFNAFIDYGQDPIVSAGKPRTFKLVIENNLFMQQFIQVKWHVPAEWEVTPGTHLSVPLEHYHCNIGTTEIEFTLTAHQLNQPRYDLLIEMTSVGRPTKGIVPIVLLNTGN
ncbi:ADP-ribosylglycohydrolase family protein [Cohnella abietis]|uniref:ADP-ribosylglycohydrolase n=1 Tax=Cohnella abietis TaxID=2507935 RepID=A0A3T1D1G6_9BACL|nr:ADP-ribosylglycohydrolase family protein [Cohnella abietis]BBI31957.1 hypothetical protein KCTCHS21_13560 [Cohnella abietis]